MHHIAILLTLILTPCLAWSALLSAPPEPSVLYGPQGQQLNVYTKPNGGHVGYDEKGQRFEEFKTPGGGSTWYNHKGELFGQSYPFPSPTIPPLLSPPGTLFPPPFRSTP
jgi:hypothetical protein